MKTIEEIAQEKAEAKKLDKKEHSRIYKFLKRWYGEKEAKRRYVDYVSREGCYNEVMER